MFLPFTCVPRSTHGRQFDVRERRETCLAAPLLPHRAPCRFVPSTTPSNPRRLDTFCNGGMSANARASWNKGCSPVSPTTCKALRSTTHKSFHGFADGSSGCQDPSSFPALFICGLSSFNSEFLSVLLGTSAKSRRQRQQQSKAQASRPCRGISRDNAARESHRGGSAKFGE